MVFVLPIEIMRDRPECVFVIGSQTVSLYVWMYVSRLPSWLLAMWFMYVCVCMCSTRCRFRVVEVKQAQKQHQSVSLWLLSTEACYFRCIVTFFSSFIFQYSPIAFFIKCNSILHIERIRWATTTTATTATYSMAIIAFPLVCIL